MPVHAGSESGRLLAANTVGAIIGTFVVPFVLIPLVGSPRTTALVIALNIALAIVLARARHA